MKFVCDKEQLNIAVGIVQKAASPKSSLPALEGILVKTEDNSIILSAYDLNIAIIYDIEANVIENGAVIIPSRLFGDIIRKLPYGDIEISCDINLKINIKSGNTNFNIIGLSADEFPEIPYAADTNILEISANALKRIIRQTIFAAAVSEMKPVLTGILFDMSEDDGYVKAVAVDGFRLALKKEKYVSFVGDIQKCVIPARCLSELIKILPDESEDIVKIDISNKNIIVSFNKVIMVSRVIEGEFLNYKTAIPTQNEFSVDVDVREFLNMIERAALLTTTTIKSPIKCEFDFDSIKISLASNIGSFSDEIKTAVFSQKLIMGFNHKYLIDALSASLCERVVLEMSTALSPIVIKPLKSDDFLFLVLPVRLNV